MLKFVFNSLSTLCAFFLVFITANLSAQLSESFEIGLPASYSPTITLQLQSGVWTCSPNQIESNNSWVSAGSYSCQLKDATGSEIFSPTFSNGLGTLSLSARSSGKSGSLQINISKDNGLTWTAIARSPFALTDTPTAINVAVNDLFVNKIQFKRTDGTVLIDNVNATSCTQTRLKVGDLAILQLNESSTDRFSFLTFVDINAGTEIWFTDNGFETPTTCRTGEGTLKFTAPSSIPAGTTISWYNGMNATGTGWETAAPSSFAISGNDQLFAYQGVWNEFYQLICGMSLSNWLTTGTASPTTSYLPAQLTDGVHAFSFPSNKTNAYYSGTKTGIKDIIRQNVNSSTNWTTKSSDQDSQAMSFTFTNSQTINSNTNLQSLNIETGETLVINPAIQLTVGTFINNGTLRLLSDATGTATFIPTTIAGNGNYNVNQHLPMGSRNWYTSSPITDAIVPNTATSYSYEENGSNLDLSTPSASAYWKPFYTGSTMEVGKGYVLPITSPTETKNLEYTGVINHINVDENFDIGLTRTETASSKGFNLVGNPYTAYLDWSVVKALEANSNLESSIWFRTKNAVGYTFATFNSTGNQVVSNGALTTISNLIPPMQAFWVRVKPNVNNTSYATSLRLNSTMRAHCSASENKLKAPAATQTPSIRLTLSNGEASDETLLYFTPEADNSKDDYDTPKFLNNSTQVPDLYTIVNSDKMVINGMKTIPYETEISLGFATAKKGTLSLKATEIVGLPQGTQVLLKNAQATSLIDLTNGSEFSFDSEAQTSNNRFSLIIRSINFINGLNQLNKEFPARVFIASDGIMHIETDEIMDKTTAAIYNTSGQLLETVPLLSGKAVISSIFTSGVYWIRIANCNKVCVKKVIVP